MNQVIKHKPAYTVLAEIYDSVMQEVDYDTWSDYIDDLIMLHHHEAEDLLELACGTGTMAISMEKLGYYNVMATDISPYMVQKAREKAKKYNSDVIFKPLDFLNIDLEEKFDVAFMVFDSLNYLHNKEDILKLHQQVYNVLRPDGLFIYDFTTPRNSRKAIRYLNDEEDTIDDKYWYHRMSTFDEKERIHTNIFDIRKQSSDNSEAEQNYREEHHQKIYTFDEILPIVDKSPFNLVKAYDGFDFRPAHKKSLRITMVLR